MTTNNQKVVSVDGYQHISKVVGKAQEMMEKSRSGLLRPLLTSSKKETENIGGAYPSDQIVIAARLGCGKTAKIIHDMLDYCNPTINPHYADKILLLYDSYEMSGWRGVLRMISRAGDIEARALLDYQRKLAQDRYDRLVQISNTFKGLPIYISTYPLTVNKWVETKKQIQGKFPKHHIINIFDHARLVRKENESKEEELIHGLMVGGVYLKNNFEMINIFLSQMNRNIETNVSRDKMGQYTPVISDIFGSDSISQCADIVMALHRPGMYKLIEWEGIPTGYDPNNPEANDNLLVECILKNRDGWTGNLTMRHNLAHNQIFDMETNAKQIEGW